MFNVEYIRQNEKNACCLFNSKGECTRTSVIRISFSFFLFFFVQMRFHLTTFHMMHELPMLVHKHANILKLCSCLYLILPHMHEYNEYVESKHLYLWYDIRFKQKSISSSDLSTHFESRTKWELNHNHHLNESSLCSVLSCLLWESIIKKNTAIQHFELKLTEIHTHTHASESLCVTTSIISNFLHFHLCWLAWNMYNCTHSIITYYTAFFCAIYEIHICSLVQLTQIKLKWSTYMAQRWILDWRSHSVCWR